MIELRGVSRAYGTGPDAVLALAGVDLRISPGEFVALVGPSGSGKSTLLNILGALDLPTSGSLRIGGEEVTEASVSLLAAHRRHTVAHVFQESSLFPSLTALENVRLGAEVAGRCNGGDLAREALGEIGLAGRVASFPRQLSDGERQRVAIARALASGNPLFLADEPTGPLDRSTGLEVMDLLARQVANEDRSLVMATLDPALAARADRVIELEHGHLQGGGA